MPHSIIQSAATLYSKQPAQKSILNNLTKIIQLQETLWRGQTLWSTHPVAPPEIKAQCAHQTTQIMPAQKLKTSKISMKAIGILAENNSI